MSHQLQNTWVIWEQNNTQKSYGAGDKEVCEFNTVEDFWKYWSFIPKPSEVFYDGHTRKEVDGRTISGFCLFKKGIKPEWEDSCNTHGSELTCRNVRSLDHADVFWENLILGCIGETIDDGDEICGCRIVNKTAGKLSMKIEVWFRSRNADAIDKLKVRLVDAISEPGIPSRSLPEFQYKPHGS